MDFKKKLLIFLLLGAIGIWGFNLYQFRRGMEAQQVVLKEVVKEDDKYDPAAIKPVTGNYVYVAGERDPFKHQLFQEIPQNPEAKKEEKKKEPPPVVAKKPLPNFVLQGIMGDAAHPMAIILDPSGTTHISKVGQEIMGATVVSIEKNRVVFSWEGAEMAVEMKNK
jgi:type II secretory pathway component PulC